MIDKVKRFANKNKFCYNLIFILFKIYSLGFSFLCLLMRVHPVKKNKIVCCNMKGKRYGDNPKYITDEIIRQGLDYEIVWLLKDNVDEEIPPQVRVVKYNAINLARELSTAGFWIDSNSKPYGVLKRKGQKYIQTWHGSYGLKKMYADIPDKISVFDEVIMKYNAKIEDLMVSNSRQCTEIYHRAFWYKGSVLECGSPRNDIFFQEPKQYEDKVRKYFGIENKRMVLYAPTYRNDFGTDNFDMDFDLLRKELSAKFGGEWVVLVRLHPHNLMDAENFIEYNENTINATNYSVMQELLVASDILITDYSSCMFDFVTRGKLCLLYASDIANYKDERDCYFTMDELPFPTAENNAQLVECIREYDEESYRSDLLSLFDRVGLVDNGNACKQVVKYILESK